MPTYEITQPMDLGNGKYIKASPYAPALVVLATAPPGGVLVPDVPVISDVAVAGVDTTLGRVTWTTDVGSDSTVRFRLAGSDDAFVEATSEDADETSHSVTVTDLDPGLVYEFYVVSVGADGGVGQSGPHYLSTTALPVISNVVPTPVAGGLLCDIAFTLAGMVGANGVVWVAYKAAADILAATTSILGKVGSAAVNGANTVQLSGLTPETAYQAIVYVRDVDSDPDVCVAAVPVSFTTLAA
jgi:hypothetical protein